MTSKWRSKGWDCGPRHDSCIPVRTPNACDSGNGHRLLKCLEEVEMITAVVDILKERGQHGSGATAFALTYRSPLLTVEVCRANRRYFPSSARHRIPHCQSKHAGASHAHGGRLWRMRRCDECWIVCAATFAGGSLWCSVARRIAPPRLFGYTFRFGRRASSTPRPSWGPVE